MILRVNKITLSFALGLGVTLLVAALASWSRWSAVGVLLAPGMLAGAIFLPQGVESDWPGVFLAIAGLVNAFMFSWLVLGIWVLIQWLARHNK